MNDALMQVYLEGHLDVPAARLGEVMAALPEHVARTQAEPGCLSFSVTPCEDVAGRLLVREVFRDQASFDAHQARTRASRWCEITAGIPRHYSTRTGQP